MKRLYNLDYYSYNKDGIKFSNEIIEFLKTLVKKYREEYDFSDMESVAAASVGYIFAIERLDCGDTLNRK